MKETEIITGASAFLFYALCWFVHQPAQWMWELGIAIPWLSLIVGILVSFATSKEGSWKYCYLLTTILYVTFVSVKKMDFLSQVPYLAACVCFIAYSGISVLTKESEKNKADAAMLKEQKETLGYQVKGLKTELKSIKNDTSKMLKEQQNYDDEFDEVILLARNKVLTKFCRELLDNIEEYEAMDADIYRFSWPSHI